MKKFVIGLVVIISMFLLVQTLSTTAIPSSKDFQELTAVSLQVATDVDVKLANGTYVSLCKGDQVIGLQLYSNDVYAALPNGILAYVPSEYLRTPSGRMLPALPLIVTLKTKFNLDGELLAKGTRLNVEFYAVSVDGFFIPYCQAGFVPPMYLKEFL